MWLYKSCRLIHFNSDLVCRYKYRLWRLQCVVTYLMYKISTPITFIWSMNILSVFHLAENNRWYLVTVADYCKKWRRHYIATQPPTTTKIIWCWIWVWLGLICFDWQVPHISHIPSSPIKKEWEYVTGTNYFDVAPVSTQPFVWPFWFLK